MRKSNQSLIDDAVNVALDKAADDIITTMFNALAESGVAVGLRVKRIVVDRVAKKLEEITSNGTSTAVAVSE